MSRLHIQDGLFLVRNQLLSTCCCTATGNYYWEAVPCDAFYLPDDLCSSGSQCVLPQRQYVGVQTICDGGDTLVCECQSLTFSGWKNLVNINPDAIKFCLSSDTNRTSGIVSTDSLSFSVRRVSTNTIYSNSFPFASYGTLVDLKNAVDIWEPVPGYFPLNLDINNMAPSGFSNAFKIGTYTNNTASTCAPIEVKSPGIYITWSGTQSTYIDFDTNPSVFRDTIENRLRLITGLQDITVVESDINDEYDSGSNPNSIVIYYIIFSGSQCGLAQSKLGLSHHLFTSESYGNPAIDPYITDAYYVNGFGQENLNYIKVPEVNTTCPYENPNYVNESGISGYAPFSEEIQCCPQRGTHLGPTQIILTKTSYGSDFENLENTVVLSTGMCYKVSPFYFIFGKEGRFYDNPKRNGEIFIVADCDYSTSGNCGQGVPCNCVPELFVPMFNKDAPWGPFGSYYSGVESEFHPAYTQGIFGNYMADNSYQGVDYAPTGVIATIGNWTETTGIILEFKYYKPVPFYLGTEDSNFRDQVIGKIDVTSVTGGLSIASGNTGIGNTVLVFNTSGKTVYDFLSSINSVRTESYSAGHTDGSQSCYLFNFCAAASSGDLRIPANKINNLSSELFEVWRRRGSDDATYNISNPATNMGYSASTIWPSPKRYDDIVLDDDIGCNPCGGATCSTLPNAYNIDIFGKIRRAELPPPCRRTNDIINHSGGLYDNTYRHNVRPYWTTMQGCTQNIVNINKHTASGFDPRADHLYLSVSGRTLTITVASGTTLLSSTGINTDRNGSGYTIGDFITSISNAKLAYTSGISTIFYYPTTASSGYNEEIYLDHSTWWNGTTPTAYGVGTQTPINWSYYHKILPASTGDIFTGGSYGVDVWLRNACANATDVDDCSQNGFLRCVPPQAIIIDTPNRINCDADNVIDGAWLVTYGCTSYTCKTDWFIKAERCSCNTQPACDSTNGSPIYVPHSTNRELYEDCTTLMSPTLYICESNIRPDCDIPFLIKVPYQRVCISGQSDCFFGDCWRDPEEFSYCVGRCPHDPSQILDDLQVSYTVVGFCDIVNNCLLNAGYDGWCQYIDPVSTTRVRRQDIPRSWPPKAFIMEKVSKPFCTTYINPFDEDPGACVGPPSSPAYDAIGPLWPHVPFEYIIQDESHPNNGWPCILSHLSSNILFAYIRPMVSNLTAGDVCEDGFGSCEETRIDIDCNTRCCYCGFSCNGGCDTQGPYRHFVGRQTATMTRTYNGYRGCGFDASVPGLIGPGRCSQGPGCDCTGPNTPTPQWPCYDGTIIQELTIEFTKSYTVPLTAGMALDQNGNCVSVEVGGGCCFNVDGQIDEMIDYGGCVGNTCFYQPCVPPHGNACESGVDCDYTNLAVLTCDNDATEFHISNPCGTGITHEYFCQAEDDCTNIGCTRIVGTFMDTIAERCSTESIDSCGIGTKSFTINIVEDLQGTPRFSDPCHPTGFAALGLYFVGGGVNNSTCTCNTWDLPNSIAFQGQTTDVQSGNSSFESLGGDSCNFNAGLTPKTYSHIMNFEKLWSCGLYNTSGVYSSGNIYL